jgi:hypothetical protein
VLQVCLAMPCMQGELAGTRMPAAAVAGKRRRVPVCCCRAYIPPALLVPPSLACASYLHATSRPTACCPARSPARSPATLTCLPNHRTTCCRLPPLVKRCWMRSCPAWLARMWGASTA